MEILMCRICIIENVRMLPIANTPLQEIFEKLTEMKLETNTSRPNHVCYICYARLWNCHHLRANCLRSEEMLTQMLISNNQTLLSNVPKSNFLTITPFIKMSICGINESDEEGSASDERIKLEATLTKDIDIKMEEHDTSELHLTNIFMQANDDLDVDIKTEDVADDQLYPPEADDETDDGEGSELEKQGDQENNTDLDEIVEKNTKKVETKTKKLKPKPQKKNAKPKKMKEDADKKSEKEKGAPAKRLALTSPTSERSSTNLQKTESAEKRKKEELLISKSHKTNTAVEAGTLISDLIVLYKLENTTKLQQNIVTSYDVTKQSIVCSDVNIRPSRRDLSTKTNLVTHLHIPTTRKRYICDICNYQCNRKSYLVLHLRTHTGDKPFTYNVCKKQLNHKANLVTHLRTHTGNKPYTCNICSKQLNKKANLIIHLRTHTGEKPFRCNVCKKQFNHKANLVTHLRTHSDDKAFTCNICSKQFNKKPNLVLHLRTHTGEKPFTCNICKKQFYHKYSLVIHLRTHSNNKPFTCNICSKQFNQKPSLVIHLRTHTGEKPFTCNICKKKFNQKANLITHLRTHSGEKPFTCNICKKQFNAKANLVTHLRTHTGEKPFTCNICKKQLSRKNNLIIHLRTHTGEKPFTCNICNKQFTSSCHLKRHIINIHTNRI